MRGKVYLNLCPGPMFDREGVRASALELHKVSGAVTKVKLTTGVEYIGRLYRDQSGAEQHEMLELEDCQGRTICFRQDLVETFTHGYRLWLVSHNRTFIYAFVLPEHIEVRQLDLHEGVLGQAIFDCVEEPIHPYAPIQTLEPEHLAA